ncbi:MAG: carbonic anhydrase [Brachymonas sp.]|nr:carbonic anhydrase [Brachymonas sp.]
MPISPHPLQELFDNNRHWAENMADNHPGFFTKLVEHQTPQYMWLGCSDSRVPVTQIIEKLPGEVFVHRNIANVLDHSDLNCMSSLQFAVDVLRVPHILVVGHYLCGGVEVALKNRRVGLADNWIQHVRSVMVLHEDRLSRVPAERQHDALCELNTIEQVRNVANTTVVRDAWSRAQKLYLHGWLFNLSDGLIVDTHMTIGDSDKVNEHYSFALSDWEERYINGNTRAAAD